MPLGQVCVISMVKMESCNSETCTRKSVQLLVKTESEDKPEEYRNLSQSAGVELEQGSNKARRRLGNLLQEILVLLKYGTTVSHARRLFDM